MFIRIMMFAMAACLAAAAAANPLPDQIPEAEAAIPEADSGIVTTMPPLTTKRPYLPRRQSGYAFAGNIENVAYVAAEQASMIHFMPVNPSHEPELFIALPRNIRLLGAFRDLRVGRPAAFSHEGQELDLYRIERGSRPGKYTFFWRAEGNLPEGTELKGYYWGEWEKGRQEPQILNIKVVSIPAAKAFKDIPVWLSMPNDFFAEWPDMAGLKRMGFNYIDMWTYLNDDEADWGSRLLDETRAGTESVGMGEIAWIREWWWHQGQKEEDGKATLIDGSRVDNMLCLSYRGKYYRALIGQGKKLIDRGIYFHCTDPEMYSAGDKICFDAACKARFRDYLAKTAPGLAYVDPAVFEKDPEKYPGLHRKWAEFKAYSYVGFFAEYRREMETYMAAQKIETPFRMIIYSTYHRSYPGLYGKADYRDSHIYNKTLEDPAMFPGVFDYVAPMAYMDVYANYGDYDMLLPWKDTVVLRRIMENKVPVTPILCAGYPFVYAFGSDLNAEMLKYNMLEVIAGGGKGFGFWGECPFDAADMKAVAEVVAMLQPYEKLILSGAVRADAAAVSRNAMVKRIQAADGSLVLVSEYSRRPLAVEIECPVIRPSRVIELASGKTIAAITPENPRFRMELKDERAVMLYVGP